MRSNERRSTSRSEDGGRRRSTSRSEDGGRRRSTSRSEDGGRRRSTSRSENGKRQSTSRSDNGKRQAKTHLDNGKRQSTSRSEDRGRRAGGKRRRTEPPRDPVPNKEPAPVVIEPENVERPDSPGLRIFIRPYFKSEPRSSSDSTSSSSSSDTSENSGSSEAAQVPGPSRRIPEPRVQQVNVNNGNKDENTFDEFDYSSTPTPTPTPTPKPSLSNFFNFTSSPQINAPLPNAFQAVIKQKPVTRPMVAPYYINSPDEERRYVGENGDKIKIISKPSQESDDDTESDDDDPKKKAQLENSRLLTKHFKPNDVYSKYCFKRPTGDHRKLGIYEKKSHILRCLAKTRVVIVEGFTGCGKTTQIPQYILDECYQAQRTCNIVVTQPRKLAAITVAKRVCKERDWTVGSIVGYQVGMENKTEKNDTLLTFMTTGVLLQKLISSKSLNDFSHIIIDEVHERDIESDFLLLIIKKIMQADKEQRESHVKIILMSATIDTKKFEDYFVFEDEYGDQIRPQVIKIPFKARFQVVTGVWGTATIFLLYLPAVWRYGGMGSK